MSAIIPIRILFASSSYYYDGIAPAIMSYHSLVWLSLYYTAQMNAKVESTIVLSEAGISAESGVKTFLAGYFI